MISASDVAAVERAARPIGLLDEIVAAAGDRQTVLIGESTHGTDDFYRLRADITRRLIEDHGFDIVAIEGDWPDTWRINEYVMGRGADQIAAEALGGFLRFPAWMWRNSAMLEFVGWLHDHNEGRVPRDRAGVYGLDLYSLHASGERVLDYLRQVDPDAVPRARRRYECLDGTDPDPQRYGREVMLGVRPDCERELLAQIVELTRERGRLVTRHIEDERQLIGHLDDAWFDAQQNALVARNAERYYRTMFRGDDDTWNLRDRHMAETLVRLQAHRARRQGRGKAIVWAHNSHVGDARATVAGPPGQWTLGQLVRQAQAADCMLIGFTTYHGTVTAARNWDEPGQHRRVLPALPDSYEALFHRTGHERFVLLPEQMRSLPCLHGPLLQRAIGVVYRPETERVSHYFHADLVRQFDAVIHMDETHALEPLERRAPVPVDEAAETWPYGT